MTEEVRRNHIDFLEESISIAKYYLRLYNNHKGEFTGPSYLQAASVFIHAARCLERILEMEDVRVPDLIEHRIGSIEDRIRSLRAKAYFDADSINARLIMEIMKHVNLLENEQRTDFRKEQEQ